jgi:glycosyltransferase involved in cell wall biosynthesis
MSGSSIRRDPQVSFVVPCYKLAHLLPDCIQSILSQTYGAFEVLVMDDCSPDNTPEVVRDFRDERIKHIRNTPNLGHLRNYNKGIGLAGGKYVWLISADDVLRQPYILERYVSVMEQHPHVGYVCCPALELHNGRETKMAHYSVKADEDKVFRGHEFLHILADSNCVIAASALVRKSCYQELGAFPLDLPYAGDWYMWCLLALHYDVAYFAEPMVSYRIHEQSMTSELKSARGRVCLKDDLAVLWRIKDKAKEAGFAATANTFRQRIAYEYASHVGGTKCSIPGALMTLEECEASLNRFAADAAEGRWIRARMYAFIAEACFRNQEFSRTLEFYRRGLREDPWMPKVWLKRLLLHTGSMGIRLKQQAFAARWPQADTSAAAAKRQLQ